MSACSRCKEDLPPDSFYADKRRPRVAEHITDALRRLDEVRRG